MTSINRNSETKMENTLTSYKTFTEDQQLHIAPETDCQLGIRNLGQDLEPRFSLNRAKREPQKIQSLQLAFLTNEK